MKIKINKNDVISFLKGLLKNPLSYILLSLVILDIITKWIVVKQFNYTTGKEIWIIPNFLKVTLTFNAGGIFGLGNNGALWSRVLLILVRLALFIAIPLVYFFKGRGLKNRYKVCVMLVYAGCIGNLIDGLFYWKNTVGFNGVVDWIEFSFFKFIFNLADSYITIAVFLIIIFIIIDEVKEAIEKSRRGEYALTPEEYEKKLAEENRKKNGFSDKK